MIYDTPIRTNAQNLDRVLAAGMPILLSFEAPRCEPCKNLDTPLKELAGEYAGRALIVRVEDSMEGNLVDRYKITCLPTIIVWRNGSDAGRVEGAGARDVLRQYLEYAIGNGPRPAPANGPSVVIKNSRAGGDGASQPNWNTSNVGRSTASPSETGASAAVSDASFDSEVLRSPVPVLVDFWAPWCGPCKMVSPVVEEMGRQYRGRLKVAKVNTDENPIRASGLGIRGIPTLILFKGGREVDRIVGAAPKPMIQQFIEKHIN